MYLQHREDSSDVRFRSPTPGPERRMLEEFQRFGLPDPAPKEELSILLEPKVEAVYPDLVAVYWDRSITASWSSARKNLTKIDIRVLHYLYSTGTAIPVDELKSRFRNKRVKHSIERLLEAGVVLESDDELTARPLEEIFALRRLICVEAKVSAPVRALAQAIRCTWFASDVYLLLPNLPNDDAVLRAAAVHGVGVALPDRALRNAPVQATPRALPSSYASWLFNEWVWRLSEARHLQELEHHGR